MPRRSVISEAERSGAGYAARSTVPAAEFAGYWFDDAHAANAVIPASAAATTPMRIVECMNPPMRRLALWCASTAQEARPSWSFSSTFRWRVHNDFTRVRRHRSPRHVAARPAHPHLRRSALESHHLHRAVLGPITRARLHFANRAHRSTVHDANLRADTGGIRRRSDETHTEPGLRAAIVKQPRLVAILRHDEINAAVVIVVGERGAALIAVHDQPRSAAVDRREAAS